MSENKWTPEPWTYGFPMQNSTHQDMPATPSPDADQVFLLDGDDYLRAVACVNACVGMVDPAMQINGLRAFNEMSRNTIAEMSSQLTALRDQNAAMRKALESLWTRAAEFRQEAIRIRSTIKAPTDAEMRCNVRAELLEQLASEFSLALATKEPTDGK